jgi:hypothetical protein
MWYAVEIFMRSSRSDGKEALWQQNVYLVSSPSPDVARTRGEELGRRSEHEYVTVGGVKVAWHFVRVAVVAEIERLEDCEEIFGRFVDEQAARSMMAPVLDDE